MNSWSGVGQELVRNQEAACKLIHDVPNTKEKETSPCHDAFATTVEHWPTPCHLRYSPIHSFLFSSKSFLFLVSWLKSSDDDVMVLKESELTGGTPVDVCQANFKHAVYLCDIMRNKKKNQSRYQEVKLWNSSSLVHPCLKMPCSYVQTIICKSKHHESVWPS